MGFTVKFNRRPATRAVRGRVAAGLDPMGEAVRDEARRIVPVLTGELRDSIEAVADEPTLSVAIGATSDHAAPVELGTQNQPPQPYLRPATNILKTALRRIYS